MPKCAGLTREPRTLRFGIMCRGREFSAWEAACIRQLMAVEGVKPALLIIDDRPSVRVSSAERIIDLFDPRTLLWRLYQRIILNRKSQSTRQVDLSAELADVPILKCVPNQFGKFVQRFRSEEIAAIRAHDLDFIVRFAFNILRGEVLDSARYGVWSFHHGDPDKYRGQPPGFWEIYRRDPVVGVVLQRLTERLDAGVMLHRGWFRTDPASYPATRDAILLGAADWPSRMCREIQAGVLTALNDPAAHENAPVYRAPNSLQMLRFVWIWLGAFVARQLRDLFHVQQWSIAVVDAPLETLTRSPEAMVRAAHWAPEPADGFLADAFAMPGGADGKVRILAEELDWKTERGRISEIVYDPIGQFSSPTAAIAEDWHLSYPYLLTLDGELYAMPEMSEAGEVRLYRAGPDQSTWNAIDRVMSGISAVDATVFQHEGRWWLLGTRADTGPNEKLYAWHGSTPTGPWSAHIANPIKTDIRSARPAGPPFLRDGVLHRPAQDCSTGYGAAIVIHRVDHLTPERFEEVAIGRIAPDPFGPYPTGLHTVCSAGDRTVIDGSRWAFQRHALVRALKRKAGKLLRR